MIKAKTSQNPFVIKCPKCGSEYHLCEIVMPGELIGKPRTNGIIKDPLNHILTVDWDEEPVKTFTYVCDKCEQEIIVEVSLVSKVRPTDKERDFTEDTVSLL